KSRKMIGTNGSSPSLFAEFASASVSAPASTVVSPSTFASYEHARNANNVALLATESRSPHLRTGDVECCSGLYRAHDAHGESSDSLGNAAAAAAAAGGRGKAHAAQLQHCPQADAEGNTAGNKSHGNPKVPSVFLTPTTDTATGIVAAASPAETPGCAAHPTTNGGHAPHKTLSGSASGAHVTDGVCAVLGASFGDSDSQSAHESSSRNNNNTAERSEHAPLTSSSAMV
ncbi:hypothetical protein GGH99_008352, partial [Coemansia sp. RSA 1285]